LELEKIAANELAGAREDDDDGEIEGKREATVGFRVRAEL
jgi:hypothetical protein